jgi:hypothetical protein
VAPMRVRIVVPMKRAIDGIDLKHFEVGQVYDVGTTVANSGYAIPIADDTPQDDDVSERAQARERDKAAEKDLAGSDNCPGYDEAWCQIPVEANGRHGLEYQCPRCAPDGRSHRRVSNGDQRRFGSSRVDTEPTQVNF